MLFKYLEKWKKANWAKLTITCLVFMITCGMVTFHLLRSRDSSSSASSVFSVSFSSSKSLKNGNSFPVLCLKKQQKTAKNRPVQSSLVPLFPNESSYKNHSIDQFRHIKIHPKTIDLSTRLRGINTEFVGFIPQSHVLRSIVLG